MHLEELAALPPGTKVIDGNGEVNEVIGPERVGNRLTVLLRCLHDDGPFEWNAYDADGFALYSPKPETVLEEAARIVDGPRRSTYGHPRDNHARTAAIWTAQLSRKLRPGERITPRDVCLLMAGVKLSREAHSPHRDNLVDLAGWARNAEIVDEPTE